MVKPERILIACVAEDREPYSRETEYLFKSLQHFGGHLARSQQIAYFVGPVRANVAERLARMGVLVKVVQPVDARVPHANKIRMLDEAEDFDVLVALDTDIVVSRDFSTRLKSLTVMAKPVDMDPLTIEQWMRLFNHLNVEFPSDRYATSFTQCQTIPYFNSGVLVVPKQFVSDLYNTWAHFIEKVLEAYGALPDIAKHRFFTDQFALSLALQASRVPYGPLPLEMNFPTHSPIHPVLSPEKLTPDLIHYHHLFSSRGEILHCTYPNVNELLDRINPVLLRETSTGLVGPAEQFCSDDFNSREFWERRYATNPELGSGIGSRGEYADYKRELLKRTLLEHDVETILDVGCGDLEFVKTFPFEKYVGVDISAAVIAKNRASYPMWTFVDGDFIEITRKRSLRADCVLCLDVLIHQHEYSHYRRFASALIDATDKIGLISGYEAPPREAFRSEITAYHEPHSCPN